MSPIDPTVSYRHPGSAFLEEHQLVGHEEDVWRYVAFLQQAAGLSDVPPIDLTRIYQHFGMPTPVRAPLVDQQGILVDRDAGLILIKEDDPIARQRFTEGHELMELLFDALDRVGNGDWDHAQKEHWCDRGAAELLMPQSSFGPQLQKLGLSLATGQTLATAYQTSLQATLIRMVQHSADSVALILWHPALRRQETDQATAMPKLRVWWRVCSATWRGGFIPKNKSIAANSLIAQVQTNRQPRRGKALISFGSSTRLYHVEAMPLQVGDQPCVLSLLQSNRDRI